MLWPKAPMESVYPINREHRHHVRCAKDLQRHNTNFAETEVQLGTKTEVENEPVNT